ncbi:MAG: dockerin type I repeat-containing protein [Oscillospiraceae bacterium]|nr:dockerin type I repeat-containing protein [Oscillospiraceae bacterium]
MKHSRIIITALCCAAITGSAASSAFILQPQSVVSAQDTTEMAHDPSRNIQEEGVGNPFNYGERNTPENASTQEIRAINHKMSVQEVKYSLFKEVDEHWDLIKVRFGETEREKVYALFLGLASRESTLGGNGDGSDLETAQGDGFGVSSAHAYGPMQTAVTAFLGCDPTFMKEDDVPEMFQYTLSESTFYDCIISNHMGIRKLMHFVRSAIVDYNLEGYQVVRASLKAFNTGWANYTGEDDGYYKNYPDEIIAMAHWYYDNGHLYDNVFTWTNDERCASYRNDPWGWWKDVNPSLDPITEAPPVNKPLKGDVDVNGSVTTADFTKLISYMFNLTELTDEQAENADMDDSGIINIIDVIKLKQKLLEN